MKFVQHWLKLVVGPTPHVAETINVVSRNDVQWGSPIFRAPALPTPHQLNSELPFTQTLRPRFRSGR